MRRAFLFYSLLLSMILIPSLSFAFGGPAPELEEISPEVQVAPSTVEAKPPQAAPEPSVVVTPEIKAEPVAPTVVAPPVKTGTELYKIRVGIFSKKEPAVSLMHKLKGEGHAAFLVSQSGLWRVQVGAYRDRTRAEEVAALLKAKAYPVDIVVAE